MLLLACPRLAPQQRRARGTSVRRCAAARLPTSAPASLALLRLPPRPRLAPPPLRAAVAEASEPTPTPELPPPPRTTPGLAEANVSYCLGCLWLLFLTDLSGVGPVLLRSDNVALSLAALQWVRLRNRAKAHSGLPRTHLLFTQGGFVAPTVAHSAASGFDLRATFAARGCSARALGSAAAGGACLWVLLSAATALRGGVAPDGAEASFRLVEGAATLFAAPADARGWAELLGLGAFAPAAGEELLFRGYLLTALRSRLGRIDAAALAAVLFACFHLSYTQFFPTAVLGLAAGAAAVATDSVLPAIAVHAAHNAAALTWGAATCAGVLPPGPPGAAAVALAAGGLALALQSGAKEWRDADDADK